MACGFSCIWLAVSTAVAAGPTVTELRVLEGHTSSVMGITFSPDRVTRPGELDDQSDGGVRRDDESDGDIVEATAPRVDQHRGEGPGDRQRGEHQHRRHPHPAHGLTSRQWCPTRRASRKG